MILNELRDKHKGERCFILGTGPSLNETNVSLLRNETCIGVNMLYKGLERWGVSCRYYSITDPRIWYHIHGDLMKIDSIFFVSEEIQLTLPGTIDYSKCFVLKTIPGSMWVDGIFSTDLTVGDVNTDNIVCDALQHAFYLGFNKVYLLGCDCSTQHFMHQPGDEPGVYEKTGKYHAFSDDWRVRYERAFISYRICKEAYEKYGREIINCTKNGNLEIFKRMKLEDVLV